MFPCAMSAGIVSAEARIVRLHLSEAYHGAPDQLLFLSLIFVIFACLSFSSSSFSCSISFFLYFCTLCLSLRFLSLFLLFQLNVLKAVFIDFFAIFVKPLQRPEVGQLHLLHMRKSARNTCIRPFVHPCDILKRTLSAPSVASFVYSAVFRRLFGKENCEKI